MKKGNQSPEFGGGIIQNGHGTLWENEAGIALGELRRRYF